MPDDQMNEPRLDLEAKEQQPEASSHLPPDRSEFRYTSRSYDPAHACIFRRTKAKFGGLSNMAAGFPLVTGTVPVRTAEALYQACRYPHLPDLQAKILAEASPMSAKMVSKKRYDHSRPDWDRVKVRVMRWCLEVKLAQHFATFGRLLETTGDVDIVEESARDRFWGAVREPDGQLRGVNALGRLLMALRDRYALGERYRLLYVEPPRIARFHLLTQPIGAIDARQRFLEILLAQWRLDPPLPSIADACERGQRARSARAPHRPGKNNRPSSSQSEQL